MTIGFVALHRQALDHPLFQGDAQRLGAWLWLIARAAWKPTRFNVAGHIVTLDRGQLCASRSQMAKAWGMSESAVERFLTRLQTGHMIERATGQGKSIITVCNYSKYQDLSDEAGQATEQETGQRPDSDRTAKEQSNHVTNEGSKDPSSLPARATPQRKIPMTADWQPGRLPDTVARLAAQWPPERLEREIDGFRDYWLDRNEKRPGWDRTFHNRIRDIHDRIMKESANGRSPAGSAQRYFDCRDTTQDLAKQVAAEIAGASAGYARSGLR